MSKHTKVGRNLTVYSNVTIGRKRRRSAITDSPNIGNNVIIYSNAAIIGPVKLGNNCHIAAGSVVVKDVPPNSIVAGVPAKVIQQN